MKPKTGLPAFAILLLVIAMTLIIACGSESPSATPNNASVNTDTPATEAPAIPEDSSDTPSTATPRATDSSNGRVATKTKEPNVTGADATRSRNQISGETATPEPTTAAQSPEATPRHQATATQAPHADPTPESSGICSRTPAVKEAIMEALAETSCSAVTEDQLAQVDSLTFTADKVDADDVAGLTAITSIDLTLTGAPKAQLASLTTLKDATISLTLPPTIPYGTRLTDEQKAQNQKNLADYTVADDFLPFAENDDENRWTSPEDRDASFDTLRFNITGGGLPRTSEFVTMAHHLLDQGYPADHLTINDDSSQAYGILNFTSEYKEANRPLTARAVKNLTLILKHPPGVDRSIRTSKHWLYRDWVDSITIINENPNRTLQIRSDFMTCEAGAKATYSADSVSYHTFELEIRGRIEIDPAAFKYCHAIKLLSLDPEPSGKLHQLRFDRGVTPPQGIGFTVLPN